MTSQHSLRTELPLLALLALLWRSSYLFLKVAVTEIPSRSSPLRHRAAGFLLVVMRIRSETLPRDWHTRILDRGFAPVFDRFGHLITSIGQLRARMAVRLRIADGEAAATIDGETRGRSTRAAPAEQETLF